MRLRVMTFNIRFDAPQDAAAGHGWRDRVASVLATVRACAPDVVGFQEALRAQLDDLVAGLGEYRAVGKPREAGEVGEYVPLLFDRRRFEAADVGDFWLSDTPEVAGSRGWDTSDPRHCTWAVLDDRSSGQRFAAFNTHLDVWGQLARLESARLIASRTALAGRIPFVVMGDFNAGEDSEPLDAFRAAGLVDTFRAVHPDAADTGTFHGYEPPARGDKLDYVLCDPSWEVLDAAIVREPAAGRLGSDHYPVVADLELPHGAYRTVAEEHDLVASVRDLTA